MDLTTLSFATPWALAALAILPIIWWLLRFTPPKPETVQFAPFRLLLNLANRDQQPSQTPWWLILLRLILATLIIFAVARPSFTPRGSTHLTTGPALIVVDDGWASAPHWGKRKTTLSRLINEAERTDTPLALASTSQPPGRQNLTLQTPTNIAKQAAALQPRALTGDRLALLDKLRQQFATIDELQVIWLSDGLNAANANDFAQGLQKLANGHAQLTVMMPKITNLPLALAPPTIAASTIKLTAIRANSNVEKSALIRLVARNGRALSEVPVTFASGENSVEASIDLPVELRNELSRIDIVNARNAAASHLIDDRWQRKTAGVVSGSSQEDNQPLLSPLYYVTRALTPYAQITAESPDNTINDMLKNGLSMLVLADIGNLPETDSKAVSDWVQDGGLLIRFAGPRLMNAQDGLVPVMLRRGNRALGSALSWEKPQALSPFAESSPFYGLAIDDSVKIHRQVLAEPMPGLVDKVWASLADGTPLITASRKGKGMMVLFHVTANPDWSNLPISGLFVEMLKRLLDLAPGNAPTATTPATAGGAQSAAIEQGAWVPQNILNGFGDLTAPDGDSNPIPADAIDTTSPSPNHPAGFYHRGASIRAINLAPKPDNLKPITELSQTITKLDYSTAAPTLIAPWLFIAALVIFLCDCIVILLLAGLLRRGRPGVAITAILTLCTAIVFAPHDGTAQEATQKTTPEINNKTIEAAMDTTLGYIITGDATIDALSRAGLSGLNQVVRARTSIEPVKPQAIDIEKDDIHLYPLIYWPITAKAPPLSDKAVKKIDNFMKKGGTIFFDTRDDHISVLSLTNGVSPNSEALNRILSGLDIPPLEPVPPEHVLTKSFYLLQNFPGRWAEGKLWVEAGQRDTTAGLRSDGVSSIIIGANDYAAAWAVDDNNRFMRPVSPGFNRQREFAYRTGINIMMYALTGNYKADQVHVPALLERLGQ